MRIGITYDTGFCPGGRSSRPTFEPADVEYDMAAIARDLKCPVVRVSGGDLERLKVAGELAAAAGLDVWLSMHPAELDADAMLDLVADGARIAESLRRDTDREVGLVVACEASVFGRGFVPGDDAYARLATLTAPTPALFAEFPALIARLNAFLTDAGTRARATFGGPVTYAAGLWEDVDWAPFDVIGIDAYRDASNEPVFADEIRQRVAIGKPVVVTEFGCCTYRGAAARGGSGWSVIEDRDVDPRIDGALIRDESEQVRYFHELRDGFEAEGVDTACWFTFGSWDRAHRPELERDLDLASFGVVKIHPERGPEPASRWSPKLVFYELAAASQEA